MRLQGAKDIEADACEEARQRGWQSVTPCWVTDLLEEEEYILMLIDETSTVDDMTGLKTEIGFRRDEIVGYGEGKTREAVQAKIRRALHT